MTQNSFVQHDSGPARFDPQPIATWTRGIMHQVRVAATALNIDLERLPGWTVGGLVRWCTIPGGSLMSFADHIGTRGYRFEYRGIFKSDLAFLLGFDDYQPQGWLMYSFERSGPFVMGTRGEGSVTIMNLAFASPGLMKYDDASRPGPASLTEAVIRIGGEDNPVAFGYIPLALYVSDEYLAQPAYVAWEEMSFGWSGALRQLANGFSGDFYKSRATRSHAVRTTKLSSVLVLGPCSGEERARLDTVKQMLISIGWEAFVVDEIQDPPGMSLEDKVRFWARACRFCVMVDSKPSGHIAEYVHLRDDSVTTAILSGEHPSSWMIGHSEEGEINYFRRFVVGIQISLADVTTAAEWARDYTERRTKKFRERYPWITE